MRGGDVNDLPRMVKDKSTEEDVTWGGTLGSRAHLQLEEVAFPLYLALCDISLTRDEPDGGRLPRPQSGLIA